MTKSKLRSIVAVACVALSLLLLQRVYADETAPANTPVARHADGEGFVPVAPGEVLSPGEVLPASRLVGIAYGVILGAIVIWVGSVASRSRRVEEELVMLRDQINKQPNKQIDKRG